MFFILGLTRKLLEFILNRFDSNLFIVETGVNNKQAIELYKNIGFKEVIQWDTDFGIRKVLFERRINN